MITVIDYGMGNVGSIKNMLHRINIPCMLSSNPEVIARSEQLILPGVGAFDQGMHNLEGMGLIPVLTECVLGKEIPLLGICLGMQLLTQGSEEGSVKGLGWIPAHTVRFRFEDARIKVPHMGWNRIQVQNPSDLFVNANDWKFYFVHSYHVVCDDASLVVASSEYGRKSFAAAIQKKNITGVQFHPEKSHAFGMQLLKNFSHATHHS